MIYHITPDQWEDIPESYKAESSLSDPSRKVCFICFLTRAYFCPGSTLCLEGLHFKITKPEERRTYTRNQESNGGSAVACLQSEEAKSFYNSGAVKVYEYHNPDTREPLFRGILYAYQWREEYAEDLTEAELQKRLEELGEYERLEREDLLRADIRPGSYYWRI